MEVIEILRPGFFTTLQDLGRPGFRAHGVPVCGAIDPLSHQIANYLAGNEPHNATLEITLQGPTMRFLTHSAIALAGADLSPTLNGVAVPLYEAIFVTRGDVLAFGSRKQGCRCYMAVSGGFQGQQMLGSCATHVRTSWGGIDGKPLKAGQLLRHHAPLGKIAGGSLRAKVPDSSGPIRILPGPESAHIDTSKLGSQPWVISSKSDRAALRLEGTPLAAAPLEMISSPTDIGTIQLPKGGAPIILLNDGPGVGGYPRVGSILQADIPRLAQLAPHDQISFRWVTMREATQAHQEYLMIVSKLGSSRAR